jgi:hypothetical protein
VPVAAEGAEKKLPLAQEPLPGSFCWVVLALFLGQGSIGPYECSQCEGHGAVTGEYPVTVSYPAGLQEDYIVRIPLERFGIQNFYLSVQFRPTASIW